MTVLVVDDEPILMRIVSLALRKQSPSTLVLEADTQARALEQLEQPVDVVLADLGAGGLDLLAEVRQRCPEVRRVLMSGAIPEQLGDAHVFLQKPFQIGELRQALG